MPNKRTGPDYLDQKSKKKKNTQQRSLVAGNNKPAGSIRWKDGSRYDPEVLEKYPPRPATETIGVSMMRDKMQRELDKKKGKTKEKKPSPKITPSMLKKASSKKK